MSHIHVCLVSDQPIPNLIPSKIKAFAPDRVVLLVSPDMKVQAERLIRVISEWRIAVDRLPIQPFNLASISATCASLLEKHADDEVPLSPANRFTRKLADKGRILL